MVNNLYTLTLLKSFDILDCFENDYQELAIKEIANRIGMPQSSVHRIVQSLEFVGMLFQNRESKKYRLGAKSISLSQRQSRLNEYFHTIVKYMEALGRETAETVNLASLSCDKIVYIHRVDCKHVLRPNFEVNMLYPAYKTGLGTVLMAELNDASLEWIYQNNESDIQKPFSAFLEDIHKAQRDGFAFDDQMFSPGLRCVAAPIKGPGGKTLFSISVSAPTLRMDGNIQEIQRLVVQYAAAASVDIQEIG